METVEDKDTNTNSSNNKKRVSEEEQSVYIQHVLKQMVYILINEMHINPTLLAQHMSACATALGALSAQMAAVEMDRMQKEQGINIKEWLKHKGNTHNDKGKKSGLRIDKKLKEKLR